MAKPKEVKEYIDNHPEWKEELILLRGILNSYPLEESIKWGMPVFTYYGKNLVGIAAFKNHLALWFYQGAVLTENTALLQNSQEGKTKAMRQIKFKEKSEIEPEELKPYIEEALQKQKEGKKVEFENNEPEEIPDILNNEFTQSAELEEKFKNLTPGRQREYVAYIKEAKLEATKKKRLEKIIPLIKEGKGLNDRYK